ncbi:MAG: hypothetical protein QUV06_14575, partial [Cyanobium sp. CZS 48M]|nr:hypothetical protein [Cyanobium sp. CZS48M]
LPRSAPTSIALPPLSAEPSPTILREMRETQTVPASEGLSQQLQQHGNGAPKSPGQPGPFHGLADH